jgi:CHAD domain-containing protein
MTEHAKLATWLIDRGSLIEVELDFRAASAEGATTFAQAATRQRCALAKEERGQMTGGHSLGHEHKAREPDIGEELTVGQAFSAIVQECVRHFRHNQALIIAERDPEALHQARVALRRLRTAFALFRPAIRQESLEPLKSELRQLLKPFGTARNLDVYLASHGDELGWRDQHKLKTARSESYDQVAESLKEQRIRKLMAGLVEWANASDWCKAPAAKPIGKFAARRLDRAWKKVRKGGSHLAVLEEKQLHRLRIDIKELRYSVEFLAPLYRRKMARKFADSLETMQECLGSIHDGIVSRQIVADYDLLQGGQGDAAHRGRQLKKLRSRFKRLKKAGPYWR